jgi:hypothetical protein
LSYFAGLQLEGRGLYPSLQNPRPYLGLPSLFPADA